MPGRDVIVVGASAGGVATLTRLVRGLPANLPAAVLVVLHLRPDTRSLLPEILRRARRLPAAPAEDGERLRPGRIYVAPPDQHLIVLRDVVRLARGPRENGHRPAVDVLFRTAAAAYEARVVGVVLSGALDDGTAGLAAIKKLGGVAVVQNPDEATFPGMPASALANVEIDYCLPVAKIPRLLAKLAREPIEQAGEPAVSRDTEMESEWPTSTPRRCTTAGGPEGSPGSPVRSVTDLCGSCRTSSLSASAAQWGTPTRPRRCWPSSLTT